MGNRDCLPDIYDVYDIYNPEIMAIQSAGRKARERGFVAGWSGNISARRDNVIIITRAGASKGDLQIPDLLVLDLSGRIMGGQAKPSSETPLHLALYGKLKDCRAILHTHPRHLQALDLALEDGSMTDFLNIPLYEADVWRQRLYFTPALPPGSTRLAEVCAAALPDEKVPFPAAIWLRRHGLCAFGDNLDDALHLTEELEHLAAIQLAVMATRHGKNHPDDHSSSQESSSRTL